MKKLFFFIAICFSPAISCSAQEILDSCYTSATPSVTFTSSATLVDAFDADLLEWTGAAWNGAWPGANITIPPPCNTPPVRALWVGDSSVWTTGGEAFALKLASPIIPGNTYHFFFTYVSDGLGSNGAFAPGVFTNATGFNGGNFLGQFVPAGFNWETHPFSFTATAAQAGDEFLVIRSNDGSGMVLNLCAETFTDLGDDSLTICIGDTAVLSGGNGFQSYSWSTGETTSQISVTNAGTYMVTNTGICATTSDTIVIAVDACGMFPIAVFTTPDNHICPGTCTDFNNLSQNATSYAWTFPGASPGISTDVNPTGICYNTPGTYAVGLIASNAITSDTLTLNNFITVYPYPPPQGITQSGDTLFANAGGVTYQWYYNGSLIPGATESFYVASASGDYNVVATDANGCEVEAAIFDVTAGLQSADDSQQLIIYPNPVDDKFTMHSRAELKIGTAIEISVYNIIGEKIVVPLLRTTNARLTADVSRLKPGIYFLEITTAEKTFRAKFVKR